MKSENFIKFILLLIVFGMNITFAQSDYDIVQNFKSRASQIEQQINDADSSSALQEIEVNIDKLKSDFIVHKGLLDRSLYPQNFVEVLERLENIFLQRQNEFTKVEVLHTEIVELKIEVDTLSRRNFELIAQFEELERQSGRRIELLQEDIARLNASLKKRDEVVLNMIDSLLPQSVRNDENLSSAEKQQLFSETEKNNVLHHIKRAVNDNIRFLNATKLQSDDIEELKNRQQNFFKIWKSVGPTLVELYSERGKNSNNLKEIDNAFSRWYNALNGEVWESVRAEFAKNDIELQNFSTGEEFTSVVTNYINDEIKNTEIRGDKAEKIYENFVDSTWFNIVKPEWIPFLIDNKMLEKEEKDSIEVLMASWKKSVYPDGINWLYIIIAVLVIAVVFLFFSRKSNTKDTTAGNEAS